MSDEVIRGLTFLWGILWAVICVALLAVAIGSNSFGYGLAAGGAGLHAYYFINRSLED